MSETPKATTASVAREIVFAVLAGGLSWLVAPPGGLVMHWGEPGSTGWTLPAPAYALAAALVTFALGHWITAFMAERTGMLHLVPGPAAVAVLCVAFAGLQRLGAGISTFPLALVLGAVSYFVVLWFSMRGKPAETAPSEGDGATEE